MSHQHAQGYAPVHAHQQHYAPVAYAPAGQAAPATYNVVEGNTVYQFDPNQVAVASGLSALARTVAWVGGAVWAWRKMRERACQQAHGGRR